MNSLHIKGISLFRFKNYFEGCWEFTSGVNCIVGPNGVGKTTILDALNYLCFCKSYFNPIDSQNIKNGESFFMIQGDFEKDNLQHNVLVSVKKGHKKIVKHNQKEYEKLSDHIGLYPLVFISPTDSFLITEGSEYRRKFVDSIISQYDKPYLEKLIFYNKVLEQRNALLKSFNEKHLFEPETLEVWDQQLIAPANYIFEKRIEFVERFIPIFNQYYRFISSGKEDVNIVYESQLKEMSIEELLSKNLSRDRATQYTNGGIHKDDIVFEINNLSLKKFGSQGQQKTFLLALKLAQFDFLKQKTKTIPILLLDDIYEKLDEQRITQLMELVSKNQFGQIFITDTHKDRIENVFAKIKVDINLIEVKENQSFTST